MGKNKLNEWKSQLFSGRTDLPYQVWLMTKKQRTDFLAVQANLERATEFQTTVRLSKQAFDVQQNYFYVALLKAMRAYDGEEAWAVTKEIAGEIQ